MSDELYKYLKIERDEEEDKQEIEKVDRLLFLGLMFILFVVPLVIRVHIVEYISPLIMDEQILDTGKQADVFTYYKSRLLIISTAILSLLFVYKVAVLKYSIPRTKLNISLALLFALVTLSAIFAPYKTLALYGIYNRNEGTITYLCYFMLFFIAANIRYTQKRLKWALYCLYPFVLINTLLGIVNFYGYNVLELEWIKKLLYSNLPEGANLTEGSRLIATINQWNYVSGISAFFIVLFSWMSILEKKILRKVINGLFASLSFAMLLSSLSSSGFVTLVLISPLMIYVIIKLKNKKQTILSIFALFLVFAMIYVPFVKQNSRVWDETIGFFVSYNPFNHDAKQAATLDRTLHDVKSLTLNIVERLVEGSLVYADEQEYKLPELPGSGVAAGTGRAFIWQKTLELIVKRPMTGYGLDTLPYFFDQDDPEKNANLRSYSVIVDKPHNMYIGMAFGAGVFALLFLIVIFLLWFIKVFRNIHSFSNIHVMSISLGLVAYLIQGLFNDSIIGTAVFFWVFLGLSLGFVERNQEINKQKVS